MTTKDVRPNMHTHMEQVKQEIPEFMDLARMVLKRWEAGSNALLPIVAQGLKEAYEMGVQGIELTRTPVAEEDEEPLVEAPHRPRRTRAAAVEEPPATTRIRRTRGSV
jgi:hypothetical protein